jgi:hypothetical protein
VAAARAEAARLERNREALVILSLIAAIMVSDFLFDGFRFALKADDVAGIAHERSFAFGGDAIATLLSGLSPGRSLPAITCRTGSRC